MKGAVTITSLSRRPTGQVERLVRFALEEVGPFQGSLAVRVKDERDLRGWGGSAFDRRRHGRRKWTRGTRYGVTLGIARDGDPQFGRPIVCMHATRYRDATFEGKREMIAAADAQGRDRLGRWPIFRVDNWREQLVHLAAHEFAHVLQYDRERGTASEVLCEEIALRTLTRYRETVREGD